ncbi:MAG TPA: gamma-glutamyl-gamma-aminobutyrate hydrolase family protein [Aggregatilineales bacterium]|nr:gamma-glutamyl-gamma-aminobutyrate hydrolase family protein [Aggregatilineales bacterium]
MSKPLIGITCGAFRRTAGDVCYGAPQAYARSVTMAGGLAILIPPNLDDESLREVYEHVDAVLLSGGGDVDPVLYCMSGDGMVYDVDGERDRVETAIVRWASHEDKPLFGICRGAQVANVALGGTLYRDIAKEHPGFDGMDHELSEKTGRDQVAHAVEIKAGSKLSSLIGQDSLQVNTLHHQALRDVAPRLAVTANAPDGVIEGVELPGAQFFVAVQWHPEEMTPYSEPMRRLFAAFVESAAQAARH